MPRSLSDKLATALTSLSDPAAGARLREFQESTQDVDAAAEALLKANPDSGLTKADAAALIKTGTAGFAFEPAGAKAERLTKLEEERLVAEAMQLGAQGLSPTPAIMSNSKASVAWFTENRSYKDGFAQAMVRANDISEQQVDPILSQAAATGDPAKVMEAFALVDGLAGQISSNYPEARDQLNRRSRKMLGQYTEKAHATGYVNQLRTGHVPDENPLPYLSSPSERAAVIAERSDFDKRVNDAAAQLASVPVDFVDDPQSRELIRDVQAAYRDNDGVLDRELTERLWAAAPNAQGIANAAGVKQKADLDQREANTITGTFLLNVPDEMRDSYAQLFLGARTPQQANDVIANIALPKIASDVARGTLDPLEALNITGPENADAAVRTAAVAKLIGEGRDGSDLPKEMAKRWAESNTARTGISDIAGEINVPFAVTSKASGAAKKGQAPTGMAFSLRDRQPFMINTITSQPDFEAARSLVDRQAVSMVQSIVPAYDADKDALRLERTRQVQVYAILGDTPEGRVAQARISEIDGELNSLAREQQNSRSHVASILNKAVLMGSSRDQKGWVMLLQKDVVSGVTDNWQAFLPTEEELADPELDIYDRFSLALTAYINLVDAGGFNVGESKTHVRDSLEAMRQPLMDQMRQLAGQVGDENAETFWKRSKGKPSDFTLLGPPDDPYADRLSATLFARSFLTAQSEMGAQ